MASSSSKNDAWKIWEKSGRNDFSKQLKSLAKDNTSPFFLETEGKNPISRYIYNLLSDTIRGTVKKDTLLSILGEISHMHNDLPSLILDMIGIIDAETDRGKVENYSPEEREDRATFCHIVKDVEKFLSERLMKERLEIDTLNEAGTIKTKIFYTKFIKVKTKLYYKQRRFNLFREESEGYAKLITELNSEPLEHASVNHILEIIKSLIGCFNLDPNRVLDIILESFESRPEHQQLFVALLKSYMPNGNVICEILGYKYRYFADGPTPVSLYTITALLLQSKIIQLNDIYSWLNPPDRELQKNWQGELDDAKEYVRKLNVISTNKDKEMDVDDDKDDADDNYDINQKWNLCAALLRVGDWTTAQSLIDKLPLQSVIVREPVATALANIVHHVIEPIYAKQQNRQPNPSLAFAKHPTVTQAHTFADLREHAFPMAIKLGPSLYMDPILLYKWLRLMNGILSEMKVDVSTLPTSVEHQRLYSDCLSLLDASILPALSYMDANCCVAEEIWSVIKYFPYQYRYSLYARWKNDTYLIHPRLIRRSGAAQKQIKALMKRVSTENVKPVGRSIGKLSHCSPGFLFDYILLQIQIYDNLIGPVVDSLKYLTSLSYDVLGYCLIEALAQADRNRYQHDGTSLSMWLQGSANFCGAIYKKYNIELAGLLQYVANQLKAHKSLDLLILKELCQKMTGIEATEVMTGEQLDAMAGGELLRSEAGYFSQVRNTKKSSQRLKDALASNDLAVTLCLLMAQQKHCVVYRETANNHLKLVGKLYDQCQDTLVQFGTFLGSSYSVDEYMERLPSIHSMLQEYHMHADVAFFLARPMFTHQINQKYDQLRKSDLSGKKLTTAQKQEKYLEATAAIILPIADSVRPLHSSKVWDDISPQFLVTFWSLCMYDLDVPNDSYQREIHKLRKQSAAALDSKEMNPSKNRKECERYIALVDKLQDERKKQQEHVDKIKHRLNNEKDQWFLSRAGKSTKNEAITQFLQLCLFPRCTFTALDAIYCAKFVHMMHVLKTPNFSTLLCYDRIFCDIRFSMASCTENEATRYGRFLCTMLETVMRWHSSVSIFNEECENYPGFVIKFRVSNQCSEPDKNVDYENYRHLCLKWHFKITKAMVPCLESKDYMQIRNALLILMRILPRFPRVQKHWELIAKIVNRVVEEEKNKRQDLFVLASSYIGQLKARTNDVMKESDFHMISEKTGKSSQETPKTVNGNVSNASTTPSSNDAKETNERVEKKSTTITSSPATASTVTAAVTAPASVVASSPASLKQSSSSANSNGDKESKREMKERESTKESKREMKERNMERESKREVDERESIKESKRDKDENDGGSRKRERGEKRREKERQRERERRTLSPQPYYDATISRYYSSNDQYDERERDRDRDLSSISNSSNGSTNRRSQESPEHDRDMKRRKVDKKADDPPIINLEENNKRERSSTKSKESKRGKSSYDDIDVRKEKRTSRKRAI